MWCPKCHYGSESANFFKPFKAQEGHRALVTEFITSGFGVQCPHCSKLMTRFNVLTRSPFPEKPTRKGSGATHARKAHKTMQEEFNENQEKMRVERERALYGNNKMESRVA